ncbi:MAG TPA: hypothetical protein VGD43_13930 [Micromonospora sp.]
MTDAQLPDHDPADERLPAIGQPPGAADPNSQPDFAGEHDDTAVAEDITTGEDEHETESPRGWAGMER